MKKSFRVSVPFSPLCAALVLFLLAASSSAQNAVTVTNSAPDESNGSFGWAVTTLNASGLAGAITFANPIYPILNLTLPPISQSVTFQGAPLNVTGQNDAQAQFLFQQGLDQQNNLTFQNNGALGSGLDVSVTASSWNMEANTTTNINAAAATAITTTNGAGITGQDGGNASATVGDWTTSTSVALDGGAGGSVTDTNGTGDVGGNGGSASITTTALSFSGSGYFQLYGGQGGSVTDLGSGTNTGGTGGNTVENIGSVTIGSTVDFIEIAGNGGQGVTGGAGGAATLMASSMSLSNYLTFTGGNGASGISAGGAGGNAYVSIGSYSGLSGSVLSVTGGNGGTGLAGAAGGSAEVDGGSATFAGTTGNDAGLQVRGGIGGSASTNGVAGGNGGNAGVSFSTLSLSNANFGVVSGSGGTGASGATGGAGGAAGNTSFSLGTFSVGVSTTISLSSGNGGSGGNSSGAGTGGAGGAGGNLAVTLGNLNLGTGSNLYLDGGAGGVGGSSSGGTGGNGGAGGNVSLAIGAVTMVSGNFLSVDGANGNQGGTGVSNGPAGATGQASASIGDLEGAGTIDMSNNSQLQVASGAFGGSINGGETLEKTGAGTLTLSGENSYSGATSILNGTLLVDTGGTLGTSGVQVGSGSVLQYIHASTAANTNVTVGGGGILDFLNNSSAANAVITNTQEIIFANSSTAANSSITNNRFMDFSDSSTAGSTTITTNGNGLIEFQSQASGGTTRFIFNGTSFLDIGQEVNLSTPGSSASVTIGSIEGSGSVSLGGNNLAVGSNNLNTSLLGTIADGGLVGLTGGSLTKVGTGVFTLSAINTYTGGTAINGGTLAAGSAQALGMGSVVVNGGTLATAGSPLTFQVGSNYIQSSGGTLQIGLGGAGGSSRDRVNVIGSSSLNGTLDITSYGGLTAFPIGSSVTVMGAFSVSGIFQQVDENFSGIRLLPLYLANAVELESINPSFQGSGSTPNQKAIGADLDSLALNPKLNGLMASVGVLSNSSFQAAEGQLSPEDFTALYQAGFEGALARTALVDQRLSQLMSDVDNTAWLPGFSSTGTPWFAANVSASKEASMAPAKASPWGGFVSGNGGFFNVSSDSNAAGYKVTTYGLTGAGADYRLSREMVMGLMVGYGHTDVTLGTGGTLTADGGQIGLYGLFYSEGFYTSALVEGGINSYGTTRTGYNGTATGKTQGNQYDGALELGYQFKSGQMRIGPLASLQYSDVSMNSFTEQGSQAPLTIPNQSENSLLSRLGARVNSQWSLGNDASLNPLVQLAWEHEYNYQGGTYQAGFGTGDSFTVAGPQIGQDGIMAGAGVGMTFAKSFTLSLDYQGEFGRTNLNSNQFGGGVKVGF